MAALLSPHCRVIIHDRRNCGKSDVVIGGELSEQHIWAEEMAALLKHLGAAPDYVAGGSAGSRTSLTVAVRHPEVVKGAFVWEVSGGPRSAELMSPGYYGQHIEAAELGGMPSVAATEFFEQRIRDNPNNLERILSMDPEEFCSVMRRWRDQLSQPNPVGDLTEGQLRSIACPVLAFEGNTPDDVHHKSAAENVKRLVPHARAAPVGMDPRGVGGHRAARQHLPGIAATNCYHMKSTFYAAELLEFIARVEAQQPSAVA